jgi:hypothetical protein
MTGKREKLSTRLLLQVFWNDDVCVVKNTVVPGCFSLIALTYSSLADIQKFITPRTFIGSGSLTNRWKDEKLIYVCHVYAQT